MQKTKHRGTDHVAVEKGFSKQAILDCILSWELWHCKWAYKVMVGVSAHPTRVSPRNFGRRLMLQCCRYRPNIRGEKINKLQGSVGYG